jgi:hypothetical protein
MQEDDAGGRSRDEDDDGPRLPENERRERKRDCGGHRRQGRVAEKGEDGDPDDGGYQADERRQAEERARAGRNHLPAAPEAHEHRPPVAEHRRPADQRTDEGPLQLGGHERRREALGDIEQDDGNPERRTEAAPDVGGADVAAAVVADVLASKQQD